MNADYCPVHEECRKEIADTAAALLSLTNDFQGWRERHLAEHARVEADQRDTNQRLFERLDEALKRPPAYVTVVVSALTCIIGVLTGALWELSRFAR